MKGELKLGPLTLHLDNVELHEDGVKLDASFGKDGASKGSKKGPQSVTLNVGVPGAAKMARKASEVFKLGSKLFGLLGKDE